MWLPVSWQQANRLAGTVIECAGGQDKQRGLGRGGYHTCSHGVGQQQAPWMAVSRTLPTYLPDINYSTLYEAFSKHNLFFFFF